MAEGKTRGKKAAETRRRRSAAKKASATRRQRAAGLKAAATRKRRAAAEKAGATRDRKDPFRGYKFKLEIDGIRRAGFRECSGLDLISDPIDYREGTDKAYSPRELSGQLKYPVIILKRGITDSHSLWNWHKKVADGHLERKNGSVVLMSSGKKKVRWNFTNGWPTKWTGPSFNATANEVAIESLEIVHEGVSKQ
jgi:phage tail-like protein